MNDFFEALESLHIPKEYEVSTEGLFSNLKSRFGKKKKDSIVEYRKLSKSSTKKDPGYMMGTGYELMALLKLRDSIAKKIVLELKKTTARGVGFKMADLEYEKEFLSEPDEDNETIESNPSKLIQFPDIPVIDFDIWPIAEVFKHNARDLWEYDDSVTYLETVYDIMSRIVKEELSKSKFAKKVSFGYGDDWDGGTYYIFTSKENQDLLAPNYWKS